jgi:hypothetical protein
MSNQTRTIINNFISQFGNTPNGVTPLKYGAGTSYTDASNSSTAIVAGNNAHTRGEIDGSNHVRTLFISVLNEKGDEQVDGVNLLTYTPAITYQSNKNGITDPRLVKKLHFQGAQFLTLSSDGQSLIPLRTNTPNRTTV